MGRRCSTVVARDARLPCTRDARLPWDGSSRLLCKEMLDCHGTGDLDCHGQEISTATGQETSIDMGKRCSTVVARGAWPSWTGVSTVIGQENLDGRGPPRQRRSVSTATQADHQERIDCGARGPSMEAQGRCLVVAPRGACAPNASLHRLSLPRGK